MLKISLELVAVPFTVTVVVTRISAVVVTVTLQSDAVTASVTVAVTDLHT